MGWAALLKSEGSKAAMQSGKKMAINTAKEVAVNKVKSVVFLINTYRLKINQVLIIVDVFFNTTLEKKLSFINMLKATTSNVKNSHKGSPKNQ